MAPSTGSMPVSSGAVARPGLDAPRAVPKSVLSEHPVHADLPKRVLNASKAPFGEMLSEHSGHSGLYPSGRPRQVALSSRMWAATGESANPACWLEPTRRG